MPLTKLQFRPGISREGTRYSNEGGWYDCDKIRFRSGYVERIGGWGKATNSAFIGTARKLHNFVTLNSENYMFIGTEKKAYLENGGLYTNITPIRRTVTLAPDPFTTGSPGTGTITVVDPAHGCQIGDTVNFSGAANVDGITADLLNTDHLVATVPNANSYTINTSGSAISGGISGGGASIVATYEINSGLNTTVLGSGWGAGTWGRFTWGSAAGALAGQTLRLWFADDYGEDLIFNIADEGIYYWDASVGGRATNLTSYPNARDVPTVARKVLVSEVDRHVICFGANPIGESEQDPLLIRWSSQEDPGDWRPTTSNTAGDLRLSGGSEIVTAVRTSRQTLVWTDRTMHSLQYLGPPYTFGISQLADNTQIAGPNAVAAVNDIVFWMGRENFYAYDGRIQPLPCSVREYVFDDINKNQSFKIHAGSLATESEIWWFYPSASSNEVDKYVVFNYAEKTWYYGRLARTAWNDIGAGARSYPQATGTDSYLYNHEFGLDDGSVSPATPITCYIESADFDIGDGEQFMFIRRILPDLSFVNSDVDNPSVNFEMTARNFSDGSVDGTASGAVTRSAIVSGDETYTDQIYLRLRGRQMSFKIESDSLGVNWRLGFPRLDLRPDGRR